MSYTCDRAAPIVWTASGHGYDNCRKPRYYRPPTYYLPPGYYAPAPSFKLVIPFGRRD